MKKYTMFVEGDNILIQEADYIEDGWYVKIEEDKITLFEIPLYGGEERKIKEHKSIVNAISHSESLT